MRMKSEFLLRSKKIKPHPRGGADMKKILLKKLPVR